MNNSTNKVSERFELLAEKLKKNIQNAPGALHITGITYYVANDGDDGNDGKTPKSPWKTLDKVSSAELCEGDGVLFKRGDVFRGGLITKPCVSYGAYGEGAKPKFYSWQEDLASPSLWSLYDAEHNIWKYTKKILDVGVLVFNDGEKHSYKLIPSYINGRFVCRDRENIPFDMAREMERDLDIYWHFEDDFSTTPSRGLNFPIPNVLGTYGDLYLRCDEGNPGEVFSSIEAAARLTLVRVMKNKNVHIDNLCIKYVGCHAIGGGGLSVDGLKVTNCEIGWIGGCIQHYLGTDPNYPEGSRGTVTRYGNGVEIYGGCDDYEVSDCYIYQIYDAGVTHQVTTNGKTFKMKNVRYRGNLIEDCVYGIEYFLDINDDGKDSIMENVEMSGNFIRRSGYGWGQQRHNKHTPALIKGWSYVNTARNYSISDNIFDRSAFRMLHLVCKDRESLPQMSGNTYVQYSGNILGQYGANAEAEPDILIFDDNADKKIRDIFGDKTAEIFTLENQ